MKSIDKKVGDSVYYKYKINLPKKIEETNLLEKELKINVEKDKITIERDLKNNKIKKL